METVCKLTNIGKKFEDKTIFENLNLEINKGEMIAITGKSGSGKSTLLNIIGLLESIDSGKIELFNNDVTNISNKSRNKILRERISYLFQNFALIDNETISKNLDVSLHYSSFNKKDKEKIKLKALNDVELDLPLNKRIYSLSGGEQQRIALARVLLKQCELILADEPTGSLDHSSREQIMSILKSLKSKGMTIIIVTHDDYVAKICDRVITIDSLVKKSYI